MMAFRNFLDKNPRVLVIREYFLEKRSLEEFLMSLAFVVGVTSHFRMTILIGLALVGMLGVWLPVKRVVYKTVSSAQTPFGDLMIWTLIASVFFGVFRVFFFDPSRLFALYMGLLIVVCFLLTRDNANDTTETRICNYVGRAGAYACFLIGLAFFRMVLGYFFGVFSVLSGVFLAIFFWYLYDSFKGGKRV